MKRFRLILVVALLLFGPMAARGVATDTVAADGYKTHPEFTRLVFPAEVPLNYSLKTESAGDEKYLTLTSDSPELFQGFTPVTIEDGVVRRLDMSESGGGKTIQIALGSRYRAHRSFMVRHPGRLVVEVVGAAEQKGRTGMPVIVIDAGHGGPDSGALIPSGGKEKDLCLDLANKVRKLLEKEGSKVVMTRNADYAVSDAERASIAHRNRGGVFLSIHAAPGPSGGDAVRTYVHDWAVTEAWLEGSTAKAEVKPYLWGVQQLPHIYSGTVLASAIIAATGEMDGDSAAVPTNVLPSPLLAALDMPAVLMEVTDSPEKGSSLASEKYRQKIAEKIARGIKTAISTGLGAGGTN